MENTDDSHLQHHTTVNQHLGLSAKRDGSQRRTKSMLCALYVLQYAKGTSRDRAMLNSEKIKPVALVVIESHLPKGIRQEDS